MYVVSVASEKLHIHFHQDRAHGPLRAQHMFTAFPSQWQLRLKNGNVKCLELVGNGIYVTYITTLSSPKRNRAEEFFLCRCYYHEYSTSSRTIVIVRKC